MQGRGDGKEERNGRRKREGTEKAEKGKRRENLAPWSFLKAGAYVGHLN